VDDGGLKGAGNDVAVERVNDRVRHLEAAVAAAQRQTEFAVSNPRGAGRASDGGARRGAGVGDGEVQGVE